jgi:hypothetical protein
VGLPVANFKVMEKLKEWLSGFVGLIFPMEEGEIHSWGEIIGVLAFLTFIVAMMLLYGSK